MHAFLRFDRLIAVGAALMWFSLISVSHAEDPQVESFPEFIPFGISMRLPEATVKGGTPPYELTYRIAETEIAAGSSLRRRHLVDAMIQEMQNPDIDTQRVQEFQKLTGREPVSVPLLTNIAIAGVDAAGAKFDGQFTTLVELSKYERKKLIEEAEEKIEYEQAIAQQKAAKAQELAQQELEKQEAQIKAVADWEPHAGLLAVLFGTTIIFGSLGNAICLKVTDGIESLFHREMEWMSRTTILYAAFGISISSFIAALMLGVSARKLAYYTAEIRSPDLIVLAGILGASLGTLIATVGVLWLVCGFRGLRLVARTLGFAAASVLYTFVFSLIAALTFSR